MKQVWRMYHRLLLLHHLAKHIVVCGDFKQLPPIASARDAIVTQWLKEDIFHRSGVASIIKDGQLHPHLFLLKEQRRMHPDISAFTNHYIYHDLVGDHPIVKESRNNIVDSRTVCWTSIHFD